MVKKGLIVLGTGMLASIAAFLVGIGPCAGTMAGFYSLYAGLAGMSLGGLIIIIGLVARLFRKPAETNPSS
jgi:hypothetical protein